MANIIHKIGETLGVGGGQKEGDKHPEDQHKKPETYQAGDHKEGGKGGGGIIDKVKNQIHGGSSADQPDKKKKDKKKDKKKHGDDKHGDSSSSDSD